MRDIVRTRNNRQEETARRELIINSANNMTDEEWRELCRKREEKINERRQE